MRVEYSSNNSGGSWWLKDADWLALERDGWEVLWAKDEAGFGVKDGRYLGALARSAVSPDVETVGDALRRFEAVTKQTVTDEGCNCCGAPHSFSWPVTSVAWHEEGGQRFRSVECAKEGRGYGSGEDLLPEMFPGREIPRDVRAALEKE